MPELRPRFPDVLSAFVPPLSSRSPFLRRSEKIKNNFRKHFLKAQKLMCSIKINVTYLIRKSFFFYVHQVNVLLLDWDLRQLAFERSSLGKLYSLFLTWNLNRQNQLYTLAFDKWIKWLKFFSPNEIENSST
jgi:hypothetical protein